MKHTASKRFWDCFESLPPETQELARRSFGLLRRNASHPSVRLKLLGGGRMYSARVGLHYRALGLPRSDGIHWFWIGSHAEYDRLTGG